MRLGFDWCPDSLAPTFKALRGTSFNEERPAAMLLHGHGAAHAFCGGSRCAANRSRASNLAAKLTISSKNAIFARVSSAMPCSSVARRASSKVHCSGSRAVIRVSVRLQQRQCAALRCHRYTKNVPTIFSALTRSPFSLMLLRARPMWSRREGLP